MIELHARATGSDHDALGVAAQCIQSLFCSTHEDEERVPTMVGAALIAEACLRLRTLQSG